MKNCLLVTLLAGLMLSGGCQQQQMRIDELQDENSKLSLSLEQANQAVEQAKSENKLLGETNASLKAQMKKKQAEARKLKLAKLRLDKQLSAAKDLYNQIKVQTDKSKALIDQLKQQKQELEKHLAYAKQRLDRLHDEITEMKKQLSDEVF